MTKISDLALGVISDDDSIPILDGASTKRVLASDVADYVNGKVTTGVSSVDGDTGAVDLSGSYVSVGDPVANNGILDVSGLLGPKAKMPGKARLSLITSWQSGHGWTCTGNGAAPSNELNDTVDFRLGSQSAWVQTKGTGNSLGYANLRKTGMSSMSLSGKTFRLLLKIEGYQYLDSLKLYAGDGGFTNFYILDLLTSSRSNFPIVDGEWMWLEFSWNGVSTPTSSGSPNRAAITDLQFRVADTGSGQVKVHFGGFGTVPDQSAYANGVVSISFDDSRATQYTAAAPIMDKYGFGGSAMLIADVVGDAGCMTAAQIKELRDYHGWEVCGHAYAVANHNLTNGLVDLSAQELDNELRSLKSWLVSNGFGDSDHFAYPKGKYNAQVEEAVARYFASARGTYAQPCQTLPPAHPTRIRTLSAIQSTTTATIQGYIDRAYTDKAWLNLTFHNIVTTPSQDVEYSTANFTTVIDYLNTKGIAVAPIGDVLKTAA